MQANKNRIPQSLYWKGLLGFLLPILSALAFNIFFFSLLPFLRWLGIGLLAILPFFCLFLGIGLTSMGWLSHKLRSRNLGLFAFGIGLTIGGIVGIYILIFNIFSFA